MKRLGYLLFACLFLGSTAQAASFDCAKAGTKIEELICQSPALSKLDDDLDGAFRVVLDNPGDNDKAKIVAQQKAWLRSTRNKCADETCLFVSYPARIKQLAALDPLADHDITCEKMRKFPKLVFVGGQDLGSGYGSPMKVDYACPESLASLSYIHELIGLGEQIRAQYGPQECTGSIVYASYRYYLFGLTSAGFMPELLETDPRDASVLRYFEQWSWASPSNADLYNMFFKQFNQALPLLAVHYQQKFHFSAPEARQKAKLALMRVVGRAAGAMPLSAIESESALVGLLRSETSSLDDLQSALASAGQDQEAKIQAYSALKVALYKSKPIPWISALLKFIGPLDESKSMAGDESALFAALHNPGYVTLLLNSGANVDYANAFGKTALFYAVGYGDRELVQLLLAHGADVNHAYFSARQINPKNESCSLTATLKHTGRTPLMHAAQNSDVDMIKLLIEKGARTRDLDELGFSALDYALMGGKAKNQVYLAGLGVPLAKPAKD